MAICVLPLLALILGSDVAEYRRSRAALEALAMAHAREFAENVGRMLQAETAALQTLALARGLRGDLGGFSSQALQFLALGPLPAALRLEGPDGTAAFETGAATGAAAPEARRQVFAAGRPVIGGYGADAVAGQPGFCINVPVIDAGKVRWDLQLLLGAEVLRPVVDVQTVPHGWGLLIADGSNRVLVHASGGPPYPGQMLPDEVSAALRGAPSGILDGRRSDGTRVRLMFETVPGTAWAGAPWHVVVGVPLAEQRAPLLRQAALTLLAGLLTLVVGLFLARVVSLGIIRPIARLQALAAAPDDKAAPIATGLTETDAVADVLRSSAAARRDALARLQTFTETLETRVVEEVAARQTAQERAAQGERLQALGRLAGGVAHDFNNVLQAVNTASEVLARTTETATVQRMAKLLGHAAQQGAAITGRLLGYASRNTPPRTVPVDLPALLGDLREMLAATLGRRVAVTLAVAEGLPRVLADRGQLETVLINLAANARDAMPEGGEVRLSAARADPYGRRPPELVEGHYVVLAVTDTGIGMAPELLARVTEPFFTTKPDGRGTGLGLSLARGFAEKSGGALVITSEQGSGTTVALWLRVADAPSRAGPAHAGKV